MISLSSDLTDGKGRHARGWLFFDRECRFCTRIAAALAGPLTRRGLALAPLQDPRVAALLGLAPEEVLRAIRFVFEDGSQTLGADALLAVANEFAFARPLVWFSKIPGVLQVLRAIYWWATRRLSCPASQPCANLRVSLHGEGV